MSKFSERPLRIARKVVDGGGGLEFAKEKGEVVLQEKPPARFELVAKFLEDDRGITNLVIQKFTKAGPREAFTLYPEQITALLQFVANIRRVKFPDSKGLNISDGELEEMLLSPEQTRRMMAANAPLLAALARTEITTEDVVALGYRKAQLQRFDGLLNDEAAFATELAECAGKPEAVWQRFFEQNQWVFGYGLSYVFMTGLEDRKLEQVVKGFDVSGRGKRVDSLLKTRAEVSSLCFVEIKRHDTALLATGAYRPDVWQPSKELTGAVAQVQAALHAALAVIGDELRPELDDGSPSGELLQAIQPRSFVIAGRLSELMTDSGLHRPKFRAFELYRRNLLQPDVLTFDELFHRAKYIVESA
ncbi:Shedu immune nuclease family protein [Pelagibacterium nitratireducens]|uniref:Shedu immune nuclease family protein n=1 Tax=Pelagibacterium nitratireducens TaxID=1046114 RepID=A0ABZ2I3T7_9HYPH